MATRRHTTTRRRTTRRRNPTDAALYQASGVVDALDVALAGVVKALERLDKLEEELEAEAMGPTAKMRDLRSRLMALRTPVAGVGNVASTVEREVYRMAGGE